jgi:hypothetical protein
MQQVDQSTLREGQEEADEVQEENPDNAPHDIVVSVAEVSSPLLFQLCVCADVVRPSPSSLRTSSKRSRKTSCWPF